MALTSSEKSLQHPFEKPAVVGRQVREVCAPCPVSTVLTRWARVRPRRSSFQTTSTSPVRLEFVVRPPLGAGPSPGSGRSNGHCSTRHGPPCVRRRRSTACGPSTTRGCVPRWRRPDARRHATLPQSWIQRENWEFETHSPMSVFSAGGSLNSSRTTAGGRAIAQARPAGRRAAGPATGSRPPSRRGRSRAACIANARLGHEGEGVFRRALPCVLYRV